MSGPVNGERNPAFQQLDMRVEKKWIIGTGGTVGDVGSGAIANFVLYSFSTFLPAFLLSGFAFAIANMPLPVQVVTFIVPARYFVALVKGIFLRGVGLETLWPDALFLSVFAVVVIAIAIRLTRKKLG